MEFCPLCNDVFHKKDLEKHILTHKGDYFLASKIGNCSMEIINLLRIDPVPIAIEAIKNGNRYTILNDCIRVERTAIDEDLTLTFEQSIQLIKSLTDEIEKLENETPTPWMY